MWCMCGTAVETTRIANIFLGGLRVFLSALCVGSDFNAEVAEISLRSLSGIRQL